MKKAILIFAHKDAFLLNTLIEQLTKDHPDTDVFVHLDKKSELLKKEITHSPQVRFIKNNVSVTWGDDTMMKALFNSWDEIFSQGKDYDYFIMCTGQDLAVKPHLDEYLENNQGRIWLDCRSNNDKRLIIRKFPRFICRDLSHKHRLHPKRFLRSLWIWLSYKQWIPEKKLPKGIKNLNFYISYNWSVMPYEVFKWGVKRTQEEGYRELYADTFIPEDYFLGTLIMNSPFADKVEWKKGELWSVSPTFHYPFEVHPKVLDSSDIPTIDASGCMFARKFDSKIDSNVINYYKHLK